MSQASCNATFKGIGILFLTLALTLSMAFPTTRKAAAESPPKRAIILATTTSTQDSGLLDALIPIFQRKTGYVVKAIAVGTGEALAIGKRGEADVLLVHAPEAEEEFMAQGHGLHRKAVMHNNFVIVGPFDDPAKIKGMASAAEALKKLAQARMTFVSRGDGSGTHKVEQSLWKKAGIDPKGNWYLEAGQGMGEVLRITAQKRGYALTDRGTYLALRKGINLTILVEGDPALQNFYSVILVNPSKHTRVNRVGAQAFADFLVSVEAQALIKAFGVKEYGQPLFYPDAIK
ncbi:MAG: substrate-binding domain-containing protein [candidate division NC10 bacterium]|nr:substrate-binding domain-containing protein [candidate division NC10 bacterium]